VMIFRYHQVGGRARELVARMENLGK